MEAHRPAAPPPLMACESEAACQARSEDLGLLIGGAGYGFASDYATKGCYAYEADGGPYAGRAYWGEGGSAAAANTTLASPKYRVYC